MHSQRLHYTCNFSLATVRSARTLTALHTQTCMRMRLRLTLRHRKLDKNSTLDRSSTHDDAEHAQPSFSTKDPTQAGTMANLDSTGVAQETHLANHQTGSESSSPSITKVQKQQSFEATTAVLDTNDLLHMIIAEVPLEYRTAMRGVSKTWKAAVTKIGYTLDPIGYDNHY